MLLNFYCRIQRIKSVGQFNPNRQQIRQRIIWAQLFNLSPRRNKEQKQIRFPAFKRIKCCEQSFPIQVYSNEEKMLDQQDWVGRKLVDERSIVFMAANMFSGQKKIIQGKKGSPMDKALVSLPENASLKFLMPSRRHQPQVEPLLATYKFVIPKGG